jgi:prepilin-type N-terminal cleavage/methylation domain-containing protein
MRTVRNKAFTLLELLMVIMLIVIVMTLVVLSVIRMTTGGHYVKCNSNIRQIITGLTHYDNECDEMPRVPTSDWNVRIGTNLKSNPFTGTRSYNHSANLWLLAREDCVALSAFVCPATTDVKSDYQPLDRYWDFASSRNISYGIQSPYGYGDSLSRLLPEGVVLVADGSPYVQSSEADDPGKIDPLRTVVNWGDGTWSDEKKRLYGNSPNHNSEGQYVGYLDGSASWRTAANCGRNADNIYAASNHKTKTSAGGLLREGVKNSENDTLILP